MKLKKTNSSTQTLNPFLGFGWCTGTKSSKKSLVLKINHKKNQSIN